MKILPCPYCGEKERVRIALMEPGISCVECDFCGARGRWYVEKDKAISRWNDMAVLTLAGLSDIQDELAAYNKLSGGKTAIEYAMFIESWKTEFSKNFVKTSTLYLDECLQYAGKMTGKCARDVSTLFAGICAGLFMKYFGEIYEEAEKSQ